MNVQDALTKADLQMLTALKEGEQFELGEMLPGIDPNETVVWQVLENVEIQEGKSRMTLHGYYNDVFVFSASITYMADGNAFWKFG